MKLTGRTTAAFTQAVERSGNCSIGEWARSSDFYFSRSIGHVAYLHPFARPFLSRQGSPPTELGLRACRGAATQLCKAVQARPAVLILRRGHESVFDAWVWSGHE